MAHAVVEVLEIVDVDEEDGNAAAAQRCALQRAAQQGEEMAPVRQQREGIVFGEILKLARTLLHLGLEMLPIILRHVPRRRELCRHPIECNRQGVELLDAAAGYPDIDIAAGELLGRRQQSAHRQHDAADREHGNRQQYREHCGGDGCDGGAMQVLIGDRRGDDGVGDRRGDEPERWVGLRRRRNDAAGRPPRAPPAWAESSVSHR